MSYTTDRYNLHKVAGQSLAVTECGIQICHAGHATPKIPYPDYSAHFILEGRGVFCVNGKSYSLSAGQGFLITPGADCVYTADVQKPWKYVYVSFNGVDGAALVHSAGLDEENVTFDFPLDDDTVRDIYALHSAGKRNEAKGYDVTGYFLLVMSRLVKAYQSAESARGETEGYVKRAKGYIEDNYSLPITVRDMAYHIGLDRTYLYRLFVKSTGMSPSKYLIKFRLERAAAMLADGTGSIAEIAAAVGFCDVAYFYRSFVKRYKMTPKKYKEAAKNR